MGGEIKVETGNFSTILIIILIVILAIYIYYELRKIKIKIKSIEEKLFNEPSDFIPKIPMNQADDNSANITNNLKEDPSTDINKETEEHNPNLIYENNDDIKNDDIKNDDIKNDDINNTKEIQEGEMNNELTINYLDGLMKNGVEMDELPKDDPERNLSKMNKKDESDSESEVDSDSDSDSEVDSDSEEINKKYNEMSVNELKEILKELNLPLSGNKTKLIQRIKDNEISTDIDPSKDITNLILKI